MTLMPHIHHITLTTGHTRRSLREEVGPDIRAGLRPLIDRAVRGERVLLPVGEPSCWITGGVEGRCISLTISGPPLSRAAFPGVDEAAPVPIAEVGIAPRARCAPRVWRSLHDLARTTGVQVVTDPDDPPPAPWVAALLLPGVGIYTEAAHWLGDLERCLAWAWMEEQR